ncbi:hypothetical protein CLAIMM_04315 [Cladophialophora immunda]|nr:hypothetical protein CLAIMM_04315 [Cladophialophora immunda]
MTDYAPRSSQDYNTFFQSPHLAMSHYPNGTGLSYLYSNGQVPYQTVHTPCSAYSPTYAPSPGTSAAPLYLPPTSGPQLHYSFVGPRVPTLPSQSRAFQPSSYYAPSSANRTTSHHQRLAPPRDYPSMDGTECQDSPNEDTMLSEPVLPPLEGYPDVHDFDELMKRYVQDLSPKKQDKALIHARRAANIKHVLIDKKTTAIESAQFRFWVKKMFTLQPNDSKIPEHLRKICHEGKPVAVREKLFKILTKAHKQCQHGGRDKTSAQVRKVYSWVPKELISRFVKLCPTCQVRRGASRNSPPDSVKSPETNAEAHSPDALTIAGSRKGSTATRQGNVNPCLPLQTAGFKTSSAFQHQNRWMTPLQPHSETNHVSPALKHGPLDHGDSYNTGPPLSLNGTHATPPGLNFPSVNNFGTVTANSPAYNSSSLSQSVHGNVPTEQAYGIKIERFA